MSYFKKKKVWFSQNVCEKQMSEIETVLAQIKFLLQENIVVDKNWESGLNKVLCEYYTNAEHFRVTLSEIKEMPIKHNESSKENEYELSLAQVELIRLQAALLLVNDYDLHGEHGISLTIH